jgi:hypothetical protein
LLKRTGNFIAISIIFFRFFFALLWGAVQPSAKKTLIACHRTFKRENVLPPDLQFKRDNVLPLDLQLSKQKVLI